MLCVAIIVAMSTQNIIYALHHPQSEHVYIGQSVKGAKKRLGQHLAPLPREYAVRRVRWIRSLQQRGLQPELIVLEECSTVDGLNEAERFYIAYFRSLGMSLLNCTDGGDGARGYKHTPESLRKISATHKGKKYGPKTREKIAAARRGTTASVETRTKMSKTRKGRPKTPEERAATSAALMGRKISEEAKAKLSTLQLETWQRPGYRENQIEKQKAASTPEVRARQSEIHKKRWTDPDFRARFAERMKDPEIRARRSEAAKRREADKRKRREESEVDLL